ncbi:uncharacterized protein LOC106654762 [Trichogramma pretiosum]|uniref:uncharacterized protein LOC106654762 n=1 Tax=Trichogramma pretiosum TaxID=7493 RepID=UPI0006C998CF|nr:uncharacterized protein LOC106654762 [Trichogramma pretiosum]XP_014230250.1 uncharacterized protein LOC106654762 [Trichogramma pretiosum]
MFTYVSRVALLIVFVCTAVQSRPPVDPNHRAVNNAVEAYVFGAVQDRLMNLSEEERQQSYEQLSKRVEALDSRVKVSFDAFYEDLKKSGAAAEFEPKVLAAIREYYDDMTSEKELQVMYLVSYWQERIDYYESPIEKEAMRTQAREDLRLELFTVEAYLEAFEKILRGTIKLH